MHHVRIPFDGHQLFDSNCAVLGDAPEIVAAEVHKHDVLRPLFLVIAQPLGVGFVFGVTRAAGQRSGNRTIFNLLLTDANEHFGR